LRYVSFYSSELIQRKRWNQR